MKRLWMLGLGAMLLPLSGCNRRMEWSPVDMWNRSRFKPLEAEPFFANGSSTQAPVPGTVARGQLRIDEPLYQGRVRGSGVPPLSVVGDSRELNTISRSGGGNGVDRPLGDNGLGTSPTLATTFPFPVTYSVLKRGEQRFNVYCSPCHSRVGDGHGMIVERGFPSPPSFHIQRLRKAPVGHYFDVITHGYGAMYPYASRVEVRDRWAIIAYIRLLQERSAKYGIEGPQREGGPGLPVFKGGKAELLPGEIEARGSEHGEHGSSEHGSSEHNSSEQPSSAGGAHAADAEHKGGTH